ncbi:unnamed protein product [Didymodactylos carnosus]|uniref:Butyrate kinase n=1 Tax=Didymodactylos carnosus TaxID=1234261 RepID=A0A8S2H3K7_9BILA|nr:unnamed protein product [Didymodactylos carnosus]CAF3588609.1 unnamed protein product [Didymodactylos carnosus]
MSKILVINSGSSSLKLKVFDTNDFVELASGLCERIGIDGAFSFQYQDQKITTPAPFPNHTSALEYIFEQLKKTKIITSFEEISAVGHRVVHGGSFFSQPVIVGEEELAKIRNCISLAPLHNPGAIAGIEAIRQLAPELVNVACFDTAFHQTMPSESFTYALPQD